MQPPRRLAVLSRDRLGQLSVARLLAYRKKALSLENSPEESDYGPDDIKNLDEQYIWFKSDARWKGVYSDVLAALAAAQR